MSDLSTALSYLERGDWQAAHEIVQRLDCTPACWAHGIVHLMEGDVGNARYWYRRTGRELPPAEPAHIDREIAALRKQLA